MATKTLYVQDRDLPIWEAAKRVAARRQVSESQLVKEALEDYLPRIADEPASADRWAALAADAA